MGLQYEGNLFDFISYDGTSIVKWNIDLLSEHQLKNVIHCMAIYINASKARGNNNITIAKAIIVYFTCQFKD